MRQCAEAAALPAASLILASISLLFSTWYGEIRDAIAERRPTGVDAQNAWKQLRDQQRRTRVLPLAAALLTFLIVFAPDVVSVGRDALDRVDEPSRWDNYESPAAALVLVWLFAAAMTVHVVSLFGKLSTVERQD